LENLVVKRKNVEAEHERKEKNNIELFDQAQKEIPDLLYFLSEIKVKANRANNSKGIL